jgi:CubicO group peptidase (beta-lactamase class C family)
MVVRAGGEVLLDLAIGVSRTDEAVSVTSATPFQVMSASKPVVSFAVAVLEDRGLLDVSRPVAQYVPEFGQAGKGEVTVLDVLTHRAGVLVSALWDSPHLWPDWQGVQEEIWRTVPRYPRGTLAYHPREFGWILAEVVRRVSGQTLPEFVAEVIPDFGTSLRFKVDPDQVTQVAHTYWQGSAEYRFGGEDLATRFDEVNNAPETLTSLVPGASMLTTATALALFYEMIVRGGVAASGERLIRTNTLDAYLRRAAAGRDRTSGNFIVVGRGFMRGWRGPHTYGWWGTQECVGHPGGFNTVAFCDLGTKLAVAIVTNGNRGFGDLLRRFAPLGSAVRREFAR